MSPVYIYRSSNIEQSIHIYNHKHTHIHTHTQTHTVYSKLTQTNTYFRKIFEERGRSIFNPPPPPPPPGWVVEEYTQPWTISTWSVSLPTILGGRDRDDVVVVPILDKELHTGFHTKTTQVLATSLSIAQSHVRTCWNHCQINNTQSRTRRNHKI